MRLAAALLAVFVAAAVPVPAARVAAAACGLGGTPTTTVYLPNVTKTLGGPSGWVTPFIVQNVGAAATTLEVSFYRFSDGSLVTCRSVPGLLPGTSFADMPNNDADLPADSQFSVVVRSFGSQVVSVVNQHQGAGERAEALSYVGLSEGALRVALPYVAKAVGGWTTTFVVQGLGTAAANVTAVFTSADGARTASLTRRIAPGRSAVVDPGVEAALVSGTEYAVVLTADQPIAAIVNAHNDAPSVPRPMGFSYNGVPAAGTEPAHLPYVARNTDGIGRTTRVLVQNTGSVDATPTLTFRSAAGVTSTVAAPAPVRPGRSWSFDPRFRADGTTPCPAAPTAGCVGDGEHGLVVTGGGFAVLGVSLSQATAMATTGGRPAASRIYLPNITRTLGGTTGWTTPIALQSAGATSATLRWYRFSDGRLVVTQFVPGLASGGTVKVDPRAVSGLADGTQYAVVADFTGSAVAHVLELNSLGGDGAMAYEGFTATGAVTGAPVATSIAVTPATASVGIGATQQLTATVRDQSGNAFTGIPITWSVTPATAGTISASGLFTAAGSSGAATVSATFGALRATATLTLYQPVTTIGGIPFVVRPTLTSDLYIDQAISSGDIDRIIAVVDPAAQYIETWFGRPFAQRPEIYVFADHASYARGYGPVLGGTDTPTAVNGVFIGQTRKIGLTWANVRTSQPNNTTRHELVHQMYQQITGRSAGQVPLWFVEGLATMLELTEPGALHQTMESRYRVASMAANGTLFATTISDEQFVELGIADSNAAYFEGAETVRLMVSDLTQAGFLRLLSEIQGKSLATAFAAVAGRSLDQFLAGRPARLRALAASYPGVVTAPDTAAGPGIAFMVYGAPPNATFTMTVSGGPYLPSTNIRTADRDGVFRSYLDGRWERATYTFTATIGSTTVSTTAVMATSMEFVEGPDIEAPQVGEWGLPLPR